LLAKLAVARHEAGRAAALVKITRPKAPDKNARSRRVSFSFELFFGDQVLSSPTALQ